MTASVSIASNANLPPYAILSHTWGEDHDEVTLEDLKYDSNRTKKGYEKLRFCAIRARERGLLYFWVDTCCIDKSNNNELATAINSMFRWYQNAAVYFVYLADVTVSAQDRQRHCPTWHSDFCNSRWSKRGWTLQELLASNIVYFYSENHVRLGDRSSLEQKIQEITGIDLEALRGQPLSEFGVDQKFKWGENRLTTHEEDATYSLLGMFNIFLPLIYGEGRSNALRRLRKEIKESSNHGPQATGMFHCCSRKLFAITSR